MANGYFNGSRKFSGAKGGAKSVGTQKGSKSEPVKVKAAFGSIGLPGKKQSKDRSGGVKRAKVYADSEGL